MPTQDPARRLRDLLDHIALVRAGTEHLTFEQFAEDTRTRYAVQMALMIMGEAAESLPPEMRERPGVHRRGLADIGNVLRHQYWAVEDGVTWAGLRHELAPLEAAVRAALAGPGRAAVLDLAGREHWQSVFFFVADGLPAADLPAAPLDDRLARGGDRPLRIVAYAIESERDDAPPLPARIQAACGAAKLDQDLRATPAAA